MKPKKKCVYEFEREKRRTLSKDPLRIALPINAKEFKTIVEE